MAYRYTTKISSSTNSVIEDFSGPASTSSKPQRKIPIARLVRVESDVKPSHQRKVVFQEQPVKGRAVPVKSQVALPIVRCRAVTDNRQEVPPAVRREVPVKSQIALPIVRCRAVTDNRQEVPPAVCRKVPVKSQVAIPIARCRVVTDKHKEVPPAISRKVPIKRQIAIPVVRHRGPSDKRQNVPTAVCRDEPNVCRRSPSSQQDIRTQKREISVKFQRSRTIPVQHRFTDAPPNDSPGDQDEPGNRCVGFNSNLDQFKRNISPGASPSPAHRRILALGRTRAASPEEQPQTRNRIRKGSTTRKTAVPCSDGGSRQRRPLIKIHDVPQSSSFEGREGFPEFEWPSDVVNDRQDGEGGKYADLVWPFRDEEENSEEFIERMVEYSEMLLPPPPDQLNRRIIHGAEDYNMLLVQAFEESKRYLEDAREELKYDNPYRKNRSIKLPIIKCGQKYPSVVEVKSQECICSDGSVDEFEELERLAKEEANDVEIIMKLRNLDKNKIVHKPHKIQKMAHLHKKIRSIHHVVEPKIIQEEENEELQPEVVAAILHTEEQGLAMNASPACLYKHLFPNDAEEPLMVIGSVAPVPLEEAAVPITPLHHPTSMEDAALLASAVNSTPNRPKNSVFSDSMEEAGLSEPIMSASESFEQKSLSDLIGVPRSNIPPAQSASPTTSASDSSVSRQELFRDCLEYVLEVHPPAHYSRIQLRGSRVPKWFPGYYFALPGKPGVVNVTASPSQVMQEAWTAVAPQVFPTEAQLLVSL